MVIIRHVCTNFLHFCHRPRWGNYVLVNINTCTIDYRKAMFSWWNIGKYHNTLIVINIDYFQVIIIYTSMSIVFVGLIMSNYSQTSYQICQKCQNIAKKGPWLQIHILVIIKWRIHILMKWSSFAIWRKLVLTKIKQFTV